MQHITHASRRRVEDDDAPKKKLSRRERRRLLEEKEMAKYHRSDWEIMKPYALIGAKVLAGLLAAYGVWCGLCWLVSTDTLVCACLIVGPFAGVYYVTPPPERPPRARVEEIWVYPVKSCKGVRYYSARLDAQCGLERAPASERAKLSTTEARARRNDRRWMVVDADGVFVSQRRFPKLCLVAPSLPAEAPGALRLEAPDMPPIDVPVVDDGPRIACRVWGDGVEGVDQGATAGKWVSKFLRCRGCRLVPVCKSNLQLDFNVRVCDGFDATF